MEPYKSEAVTTVEGKIISIETSYNRFKKEKGLHLIIKTSSEKYIVHVCPQWYADKNKFNFQKGETIKVKGATFMKHNEKNIYAATVIRSNNKKIKLRNEKTGKGLWKGRNKVD